MAEVDSEPFFTSARLASLLKRAEAITFKLLYTGEGKGGNAASASLHSIAPVDSSQGL